MEIEGGDVEVFTDNTRYRFGTRKTTYSTDIGKQWKVRRIMDSKMPARMGICDIVYQEGRWLSFI